jgi:hypothetical protein
MFRHYMKLFTPLSIRFRGHKLFIAAKTKLEAMGPEQLGIQPRHRPAPRVFRGNDGFL